MQAYNKNCRVKGYEDSTDWYLAWEVYKYLHRNADLIKELRYADLLSAAEYIYVCHRMARSSEKSFFEMRKICRFYVSLAKNEDPNNFVLTDEVEKYLLSIAGSRNDLLAAKVLEWLAEGNNKAICE